MCFALTDGSPFDFGRLMSKATSVSAGTSLCCSKLCTFSHRLNIIELRNFLLSGHKEAVFFENLSYVWTMFSFFDCDLVANFKMGVRN